MTFLGDNWSMGQRLIYELLQELGGKATQREIRELAKKKYPNHSLHASVGRLLHRLSYWEMIVYKDGYWFIKEK